jgi:hypothetical protein
VAGFCACACALWAWSTSHPRYHPRMARQAVKLGRLQRKLGSVDRQVSVALLFRGGGCCEPALVLSQVPECASLFASCSQPPADLRNCVCACVFVCVLPLSLSAWGAIVGWRFHQQHEQHCLLMRLSRLQRAHTPKHIDMPKQRCRQAVMARLSPPPCGHPRRTSRPSTAREQVHPPAAHHKQSWHNHITKSQHQGAYAHCCCAASPAHRKSATKPK